MKNIGILLFILISFDGYSQTKFDTEKWIISKFDKWKTENNYNDSFNKYWSHVPTSLEIKGCKLIYKETILTTQSISYQDINTYELEIGDIVNIYWVRNRLVLKSRKKNVVISRSQTRNGFGDIVAFNFEIESEKDLEKRLLKAFSHLKSFCEPTKDLKEPF